MPVHWERDGKLGYKPAYDTDWNRYQEYKASIDFLLEKHRSKFLPISIVADTVLPCYMSFSIIFFYLLH